MDSAGPGRAMPFNARLINPKPIGDIATQGEFGPWSTQEPRDTPLSGSYSFSDANLATIKGIGGILKSQGKFSGVLGRIDVQGETDTPDFLVDTGGHPMPLHTDFSATVDGSTGDTYLHPVNATLASSTLIANGSVVRDDNGRRVVLDVSSNGARIEDLLKVAVKTEPPALSGPVMLHTSFLIPPSDLPPGGEPVMQRLKLDGSFSVTEARFLHPSVEQKLDQLSARARGKPEEAEPGGEAPEVLSGLSGKFKLDNGVISVSSLSFKIPGGAITLAGDYALESRDFSFEGQARLEATLSQMTTGVKSFFLRALDPIFEKQGAGTVLPIRISGTGASPKIGLDLGKPKRGQ
jgi:AsmA-like C-terminal region